MEKEKTISLEKGDVESDAVIKQKRPIGSRVRALGRPMGV